MCDKLQKAATGIVPLRTPEMCFVPPYMDSCMDTIYKTLENFAFGDEAPLKGGSVLISEHTTQRTSGGENEETI